jgi:hypothetical protein
MVLIKRIMLPLAICLSVGALAPMAMASDSSLEKALKPYKSKLTVDVAYVANFKAPSKSGAAAALTKLSKIKGDLNGAKNAATANQGSTASGKTARTQVISGLSDSLTALADDQKSASEAKSGKASTAKSDAKAGFKEINKAIPLLESGGQKLKLF